jgi:hypothetical protein
MDAKTVVGWFLIVVGALFLLIGLVGAVAAVFRKASGSGDRTFGLPPEIPWGDVFKELLKQGAWGICIVLGLGLILLGLALLAPEVFQSSAKTASILVGT